MPTPAAYGRLHIEHEYLRAMVFKMMMSDEMVAIDGPLASQVFDLVGDQTEQGADEAIAAFDAAQ
jgi:hypothetical protein